MSRYLDDVLALEPFPAAYLDVCRDDNYVRRCNVFCREFILRADRSLCTSCPSSVAAFTIFSFAIYVCAIPDVHAAIPTIFIVTAPFYFYTA